MSKSITIKKAKEALQNLRKLTPANPKIDDDLEISIKEAIAFMAPDLIRMTKRGFTVKELSAGLAADGIGIKPATLNRYLNEYQDVKNPKSPSENLIQVNAASGEESDFQADQPDQGGKN